MGGREAGREAGQPNSRTTSGCGRRELQKQVNHTQCNLTFNASYTKHDVWVRSFTTFSFLPK